MGNFGCLVGTGGRNAGSARDANAMGKSGGWPSIGIMVLAIATLANSPAAQQISPLNTLKELQSALNACWVPPPIDQARPGMQITVQMSFKRNGELLGQPRITFEALGATEDERFAYRIAVVEMLKRCTPLPFTDPLGGAVAGRPFTIRFIDNRKLKQASTTVQSSLPLGRELPPAAGRSLDHASDNAPPPRRYLS